MLNRKPMPENPLGCDECDFLMGYNDVLHMVDGKLFCPECYEIKKPKPYKQWSIKKQQEAIERKELDESYDVQCIIENGLYAFIISRMREINEWSAARLARMSGVSAQTIRKIEKRLSKPKLKTIDAISKACGSDWSDIANYAASILVDHYETKNDKF